MMTTMDTTEHPQMMIPEDRRVAGLEYGRRVSAHGWAGHYVRARGLGGTVGGPWVLARLTPAADELPGDGTDEDIVGAYREVVAEGRRRVAGCRGHEAETTRGPLPFVDSVAVHPYTEVNRAAHGGVRYIEVCRRCGGEREVLRNGGHEELGTWRAV